MDEMQRRHLELIVKNPDLLLYVGEFAPTDDLPVVADSRKLDMARKRNKKREDIKRLAKKRSGTQEFVKATSFHEPPRVSEPQRWQTPARQSYRLATVKAATQAPAPSTSATNTATPKAAPRKGRKVATGKYSMKKAARRVQTAEEKNVQRFKEQCAKRVRGGPRASTAIDLT